MTFGTTLVLQYYQLQRTKTFRETSNRTQVILTLSQSSATTYRLTPVEFNPHPKIMFHLTTTVILLPHIYLHVVVSSDHFLNGFSKTFYSPSSVISHIHKVSTSQSFISHVKFDEESK